MTVALIWLGILGALVVLVFLVLVVGPFNAFLIVGTGTAFTAWSLQLARAARKPRHLTARGALGPPTGYRLAPVQREPAQEPRRQEPAQVFPHHPASPPS